MPATADRLSALDATFLELEDADTCAHMHIGAIMVFGPREDGSRPTLDEVRDHLDAHLDALPRYRERLAGPGAGTVRRQRWVTDEHFDIARHVLAASLPAPGGWEELFAWSGDYFSARLDRTMPLWHVTLIDNLADGHWALVTKTHHALVDGVGSVDAVHLLLDGVGDALGTARAEAATTGTAHGPVPAALLTLWHGMQDGVRLATHPRDLARRAEALTELVVRDEIMGAPQTSINATIGARRTLRGVTADLDEVRQIRLASAGP